MAPDTRVRCTNSLGEEPKVRTQENKILSPVNHWCTQVSLQAFLLFNIRGLSVPPPLCHNVYVDLFRNTPQWISKLSVKWKGTHMAIAYNIKFQSSCDHHTNIYIFQMKFVISYVLPASKYLLMQMLAWYSRYAAGSCLSGHTGLRCSTQHDSQGQAARPRSGGSY